MRMPLYHIDSNIDFVEYISLTISILYTKTLCRWLTGSKTQSLRFQRYYFSFEFAFAYFRNRKVLHCFHMNSPTEENYSSSAFPHKNTSTQIFFNVLRGHINTLKATVNHFYIVNPAVVRYQTSFLLYGRQLKNLFEYFRKFIYVHFIKLFGFCTPEVVSTIHEYMDRNMGATKRRKTNNTKPNG